jgi:ABC-2 type transport system permease protein
VAIIFFSLIGGLCYFINIGIQRLLETVSHQISPDDVTAFQTWQPLDILQWLPPGALAQAVAQAQAGAWASSLLWLGYSLLWLILITWVWYKLLVRLTTGEGYLLTPRPREETRRQAVREERRERNLLGWLPPDVAQLTANEFKSVWRVPQRRVGIIQGVLMPIFFLGAFFLGGDTEFGAAPAWMALTLPVYALFLFWANTQNMLAWEGPGLPALLLTPVPRQHIFRAKGLALFVITAVPLLLFGGLIVYNNPGWVSVTGLLTALGMGVATMGVTAVASVYFPIPIRLEGRRKRGLFQSGGDTKTGCAYITIVPLSVVLVSVPAAIPLLLAYWLDVPWLAAPGLFFSASYAFAVFWIGTRKAGELLLAREPEVVERLKLPEE